MAKYYGKIGFVLEATETETGVYTDPSAVEKYYYGDVEKISRRYSNGDTTSGEFSLNNQFSIIFDAFAKDNLYAMRYIEYMGVKWTITSFEVEAPRVIISVGGIYNG